MPASVQTETKTLTRSALAANGAASGTRPGSRISRPNKTLQRNVQARMQLASHGKRKCPAAIDDLRYSRPGSQNRLKVLAELDGFNGIWRRDGVMPGFVAFDERVISAH